MKNDMIRVEGSKTLFRDPHSKAIVNTDDDGYQQYMKMREINEAKRKEQQSMREELNNVKHDVAEIKSLLLQLLEKK